MKQQMNKLFRKAITEANKQMSKDEALSSICWFEYYGDSALMHIDVSNIHTGEHRTFEIVVDLEEVK